MVSTLLILAVASLALVFVYAVLREGHAVVRSYEDWEEKKHDIDVRIFQVLLNRDEEIQLRRFLSKGQFSTVQRRRIHVALRMLQLVDEDAGMAMALVRLARVKGDPALAQQVDELIATGFQLRMNLLLARLCLYLKWAFPSWTISLPAFDVRYQYLLDALRSSSPAAA
jgi:hypothetical protein